MDHLVPSLEILKCLCQCIEKPIADIYELQEILPSLETEMESLMTVYTSVMEKVEYEEGAGKKRTSVVDDWIKRVKSMEIEVADLVADGKNEINNKFPGTCCPKNCLASYKLVKMVRAKRDVVAQKRLEGLELCKGFGEVAHPLRSLAIKLPLGKTHGLELLLDEVWTCLEDERVRTIGIYGMGRVGKTTLLKMVNNKFLETNLGFDLVIWAEVSQQARVDEVQEMILKRLEIPDNKWKDWRELDRATEILRVLETKKFLLLLDGIWEQLDLSGILGIPIVDCQEKSKVIFTTRFEGVCRGMGPQKSIRVQCLAREKASTLFRTTVGEAALNSHPCILELAEHFVQECSGLPCALITTGKAMAGSTDLNQWEQKLKILKHCPSEFPGMGDKLFPLLAESWEMLYDHTVKSCFLYCSMFPSDKEIFCDELIQLWMGEGFLDEYDDPRAKGEDIIDNLKQACLLEIGSFKKHVKMHRIIRGMALWLACEKGEKKNKCVVREHGELIAAGQVAKWNKAQRIALWHSAMEEVRTPPSFPNLATLFVSNNSMKSFPNGFLGGMQVIKVLDLSNSKLIELPVEIGELVTLQYLNLSHTEIKELPINLKNLVNLRFLIFDGTNCLRRIPSKILSNLSSLQLFSIFHSKVSEGDCTWLIEELECLEQMSDISLKLTSVSPTEKLLNSHKLRMTIKQLCLQRCTGMTSVKLSPSLQMLEMNDCSHLEGVIVDVENNGGQGFMPQNMVPSKFPLQQYLCTLCELRIFMCPNLLNLTWLIHAPRLLFLDVGACHSMKEVIKDDESKVSEIELELGLFSRLTTLNLYSLPNLRSICGQALPFPSLTNISVAFCPSLGKLPFDSKTGNKKSSQRINGEQQWWDALVWEDDNINQILTPYFVPCGDKAPSECATQGAGCSSSTIPISGQ